jgi:hypothetical protein
LILTDSDLGSSLAKHADGDVFPGKTSQALLGDNIAWLSAGSDGIYHLFGEDPTSESNRSFGKKLLSVRLQNGYAGIMSGKKFQQHLKHMVDGMSGPRVSFSMRKILPRREWEVPPGWLQASKSVMKATKHPDPKHRVPYNSTYTPQILSSDWI